MFFIDTVSTAKSMKIKDILGYFHTIKPNKIEAEKLSGIIINNDSDLDRVADYFFEQGVKNVFISLGQDGVYYNNQKEKGKILGEEVEVVNATGAGDVFLAALVYGYLNEFSMEEMARMAQKASILTLKHEDTINPNMNLKNILEEGE